MQFFRGPLAAALAVSLLNPATAALGQTGTAPAPAATRTANHAKPMDGDERILHALNRFTFGPRAGDVEAARAMGLERWFDEQLHPERVDETALRARLAAFPAIDGNSEDLLYRMPSRAVIRQAIDGKAPVPASGALHAIYEDEMFRVAEKKQAQQAGATDANAMMATTAGGAAAGEETTPPDEEAAIDAVLAMAPKERVARLVAMQPAEMDAFFKALKGRYRAALSADMTPAMKETVGALENPQRTVAEELIAERLTRDIYANAQLQEVMTDFWLNHFNVFLHKNEATPYYLVSYERDVIRPQALGRFEDLLEATAHSPAMLLYLDNASSTGPDSPAAQRAKLNAERNPAKSAKNREGLNENYARELMELHTLGVNGGYKQADVEQVARILTGWTVDKPQRGGGFEFDAKRHEPGSKKVMGKTFKESGEREGRELLHFLATRPATAQFISRKLAVRFVSDDPPESLVKRMAKSYLSSGGDIRTVLKTMFHAPEFWSADVYRAKVKTPLEYVVSATRASHADITNLRPLANALREMGMPVYGAIPPTGYKWDAADWVSTGALVNRMNFALSLAGNRLPGTTTAWADTGSSATGDTRAEESRLESMLVAGQISESTRTAVLQQFEAQNAGATTAPMNGRAQTVQVVGGARTPNRTGTAQEKQDQLLAGLLLGSPEFQRR